MRSLRDVLMELDDPRQSQGRRYRQIQVLLVVVLALLCGANSLRQMAAWSQNMDYRLYRRLGLRRLQRPAYGAIRGVLLGIDAEQLAEKLRQWIEELVAVIEPVHPEWVEGISFDGKFLRGSGKIDDEIASVKVLHALLVPLGLLLASQVIPEGSSEVTVREALLADLVLEGKWVSADALHTNQALATTVLEKGGTFCCRSRTISPRRARRWNAGWTRNAPLRPPSSTPKRSMVAS